ncbi:toll/interleukin-1 receptor domain-containing protein [Pseudoalteromonas lipolytica]|uniref:toll/interleukin-1 receptor domain-containing protein n=1 Tax=Pseudoalteromonas lipolytica TaxID=570156 RepID=UPI00186B8C29|nr:toll/interleukin-1 receptor domain-containing protein [Pseudoalteromonas lipolytica]MBE0352726.1 hypothetical protein [Pseudoalteromonas lipolytica LMEB 39]
MEESKQSKVNQYKYHAFISYRHADNKEQGRQWATWLHQAIETYEVPKDLVGKKNGRGDAIPARIYPIFRDEEELPAHADLGTSIVGALEQTNLLVVLCSPRAVDSTYVADEIDYFKKLGGSDRIIAAMIDGEPNTSWDDSKQKLGFTREDECFPTPLQFEYDHEGSPTDKHAEPIAADFRINNDGKPEEGWTTPAAYREHLKSTTKLDNKTIDKKVDSYQQQLHLMLLKIIAGILGVPLGELTQRDKEYQLEQERLKAKKLRRWLGAVAILAILAISAGVFAYSQKEIAENQAFIAEIARDTALREKKKAEKSRKEAIAERNNALSIQSTFIMSQVDSQNNKGNFDTATLLGLNALPGLYGGERPAVGNKIPLISALFKNNVLLSFDENNVDSYLLSGDALTFLKKNKSGVIELWNIASGKLIFTKKLDVVGREISISYDSSVIAFREKEGITILSTVTGEVLKKIKDDSVIDKFKLSKDGLKLAYITLKKLKVWGSSVNNLHQWDLILDFNSPSILTYLNFSPSGEHVYTCGFGEVAYLIPVNKKTPIKNIINIYKPGKKLTSFSPDGELVAVIEIGSDENNVNLALYSTSSDKLIDTLTLNSEVNDIDISIDRNNVLISTVKELISWDLTTGTTTNLIGKNNNSGYQRAFFDNTGNTIVAINNDNELYAWNKRTGNLLNAITVFSDTELHGAWGGDRYILISQNDKRVRVSAPLYSEGFNQVDLASFPKLDSENLFGGKLVLVVEEKKIIYSDTTSLQMIDLESQKVIWRTQDITSYNRCLSSAFIIEENKWLVCIDQESSPRGENYVFDLVTGERVHHSNYDAISIFMRNTKPHLLAVSTPLIKKFNSKKSESLEANKDGIPIFLLNSFQNENIEKDVAPVPRKKKVEKKILNFSKLDNTVYQVELGFDVDFAFVTDYGRKLVTQEISSYEIDIWDINSFELINTIEGRIVKPVPSSEAGALIKTFSEYFLYNFEFSKKTKVFHKGVGGIRLTKSSPNEALFAYHQTTADDLDELIKMKSLISGQKLWEFSLKNLDLKDITFSKNSKLVAFEFINEDGRKYTRIFSALTGEELLTEYTISSSEYLFVGNGDQIIFKTTPNNLILWSLASRGIVREFSFFQPIDSFTTDGKSIHTLHGSLLNEWALVSIKSLIDKAIEKLTPNYKCLTTQERVSFFLPQLSDEQKALRNCNS